MAGAIIIVARHPSFPYLQRQPQAPSGNGLPSCPAVYLPAQKIAGVDAMAAGFGPIRAEGRDLTRLKIHA